ncbi:MAG: FAD-dependent oxidoreductase [Rhodospirillaceae bacterium]|jgi:D-amino-acid dehydrogenase|nr:FAD-dependent oxidoreductase [Rhodospirillaceae bacterium]MBT5244424.1 FAD-dependent oxidoreductase [Rhodospirillaceae bacterium]MBT5562266.1 FAD-dependent oxidoreductase [Rhodospirillaceae bacterium]MBT6240733.1 FAD-dependent oxidoreductase [Rhodospirillaceae bacterium]
MANRVTVIGAGIVGICTTLSLLEKGFVVEMVDSDLPGEGASHGNAGVISPWSSVPQSMPGVLHNVPKWLCDPDGPLAIKWSYAPRLIPWLLKFVQAGLKHRLPTIADAMYALNRPNIEIYRRHLDGTGHEQLLIDSLYVHVYRNPVDADLKQLAWRMREELGVPLQVVDDGELHEIEPALSAEYKAAVLIKAQARALDPRGICKALAEKALSMGATFRQTEIKHISPAPNGGWIMHSADGEYTTEKLVIAAGAWSARLLAPLGVSVPLEAERGYHLVLKNPGIVINNSIMDTERKFVTSSMNAGVRCAGTAEFAGLDAPPNYRRARVFKRLVKKLFPEINVDESEEWMGTRPSFPDSLPCIGGVPGHDNLFAAFGHSHYGFGMAPNTGRIVADLVGGQTSSIDLTPYRVDRFNG